MGREYVVNGETLVTADGSELGLAENNVTVVPSFRHRDIHCDDFGPDIPPEVMFQLADVTIRMMLIHWDFSVLQKVVDKSMAGSTDGTLAAFGTLLGAGKFFVPLKLASETLSKPWTFPTAYLAGPAMELPLGTKASALVLAWRAIPYVAPGGASKGAVLWKR